MVLVCCLQDLPPASAGRLWKMNAPEWPYILVGTIGALANGAVQPLFAIIFAEILGVSIQKRFVFQKQIRSKLNKF